MSVLRGGKPHEIYVAPYTALYLAAGIHVVHVSVYDDLEHHPGMVRAGSVRVVKVIEVTCLDPVNDGVEGSDRVVFRNILVQTLGKKRHLFGIVVFIMYLCRHFIKFYVPKIIKIRDTAKPLLVKVEALFYVLQHNTSRDVSKYERRVLHQSGCLFCVATAYYVTSILV